MHACKLLLLLLLHPRSAFPSVLFSTPPFHLIPSHCTVPTGRYSKQKDRGQSTQVGSIRQTSPLQPQTPPSPPIHPVVGSRKRGEGETTTNPGYPRQRYTTHNAHARRQEAPGEGREKTEQRRDDDDDTTTRACYCRCRCPLSSSHPTTHFSSVTVGTCRTDSR